MWIGYPAMTSIAVVGGGFGGVGAVTMLARAGYHDTIVFERAGRIGGVWHHNTYPGAACDVPSHLYEFSFAPNPNWSRRYAPGGEIQAYLEDVARRDGQVCVVSSRWALRRDANGEPVSMLESNRDISARLKEERKFRGLLESAPDPMVIVDGQGIIRLVNARAMNVFGYTREELVGQKVEIIVPERFHQRQQSQIRAGGGRPDHHLWRHRLQCGERLDAGAAEHRPIRPGARDP